MRRKILALIVILIFLAVLAFPEAVLQGSNNLADYYIYNSYADTGASNSVTGIYLNYRIFDTLFETLLLLVSVIGIIYFSRHKGD